MLGVNTTQSRKNKTTSASKEDVKEVIKEVVKEVPTEITLKIKDIEINKEQPRNNSMKMRYRNWQIPLGSMV